MPRHVALESREPQLRKEQIYSQMPFSTWIVKPDLAGTSKDVPGEKACG